MWKWESIGPAKAVVVLVHSAYEHHLRYAWQIDQWRGANFHVIMGDLPGHGENAGNESAHRESFDEYEKSIKTAVKVAMENELPVFIVAHGLGATLAMGVLSKNRINIAGAIFTSPWLQLIKTPSKFSNALTGFHKVTSRVKINHHISIEELTKNQEVIEQEKEDPFYRTEISVGWYHELQSYLKQLAQSKGAFPDIPVFIHTGERDNITDKEMAKRWLKQQNLKEFSYKEWTNGYHDLFQEPEREDIFISSHLFIKNVLRSLGYVVQ